MFLFSSRLYWTEQNTLGVTTLMTSDLQGQSSHPFLGSQGGRRKREVCSCSQNVTLSGAVAMDQSDVQNQELFYADGITGDIWASDLYGCQCRLVVRASDHAQSGKHFSFIQAEHTHMPNSRIGGQLRAMAVYYGCIYLGSMCLPGVSEVFRIN